MLRWLAPLLAAALAAETFVPAAHAAGINLYWNNCSVSGATNRDFACNTNSGNNDLYLSYDPPVQFTDLVAIAGTIDIQAMSSTLPAWWQFTNPGSCRQTALIVIPPPLPDCVDPWLGQEVSAVGAYHVSPDLGLSPDRARLVVYAAVPSGFASGPIVPGTEYVSLVVRISNAKTVGACTGCEVPVCLVLNSIEFIRDGMQPGPALATPLTNNIVAWQGSITGLGCAAEVPARNPTWGQIKSIYR